jgi:hypothetical protein
VPSPWQENGLLRFGQGGDPAYVICGKRSPSSSPADELDLGHGGKVRTRGIRVFPGTPVSGPAPRRSRTADAAEGLYRLVDAAYERRSLALSSNLHPSGFDQLMPKTTASAFVDRLLHHADGVVNDGESVRLADALSGKAVVLLNG